MQKKQNDLGAWLESGSGAPVILLHGFGEDSSIFNTIVTHLSGFHLLIPDMPGSGQTPEVNDMSMEGLAKWVKKWLEVITSEKAVVIGHSMGGYVALAFAELFPDKLKGLGLYHSTAFADTEEKKATRKKGIEFISKNGASAFLATAIPGLYGPQTRAERPELIKEQLAASQGFSSTALIHYYESMMVRPDRTKVLEEISLPVLFIFGVHDTAVPIADGMKQAHLPQLAYINVLENSGHMGMREEPDLSVSYLIEYLHGVGEMVREA